MLLALQQTVPVSSQVDEAKVNSLQSAAGISQCSAALNSAGLQGLTPARSSSSYCAKLISNNSAVDAVCWELDDAVVETHMRARVPAAQRPQVQLLQDDSLRHRPPHTAQAAQHGNVVLADRIPLLALLLHHVPQSPELASVGSRPSARQ